MALRLHHLDICEVGRGLLSGAKGAWRRHAVALVLLIWRIHQDVAFVLLLLDVDAGLHSLVEHRG